MGTAEPGGMRGVRSQLNYTSGQEKWSDTVAENAITTAAQQARRCMLRPTLFRFLNKFLLHPVVRCCGSERSCARRP